MWAKDDVENLKPKERLCYLPDEKVLKYHRHYSKENCIAECISRYMAEKCGCLPYYMKGKVKALNLKFVHLLSS